MAGSRRRRYPCEYMERIVELTTEARKEMQGLKRKVKPLERDILRRAAIWFAKASDTKH